MVITENRLRQVIRQIIKEQFQGNLSKSDMQLIGKTGAAFFIANFSLAAIGGMVTIYDIVTEYGNAENCKMIDGNEVYTLNDVSEEMFEEFAEGFEGKKVNVSIKNNSLILKSETGETLQLTLNTQSKEYRTELAEAVGSAIVGKKIKLSRLLAYGSSLNSDQIRLIQNISGLDRAAASGFKF